MPVDVVGLPEGRQRYGFFTNDAGGIEDDLMIANRGDHLFVVVNAACKGPDVAHMRAALGPMGITVELLEDRALLALQGPEAEAVLAAHAPEVAGMRFMDVATVTLNGVEAWVSRSGYTGEDGFEVSVPETAAEALARLLLADDRVQPIGLGARDSLRLEAGLCLYGHDIDAWTTPVAAGLSWAIQKVRRRGGAREGGFPGSETILAAFDNGADVRRVGLKPDGRAPMREGVALYDRRGGRDRDRSRDLGRVRSKREWPGRDGICAFRRCGGGNEALGRGAGQAAAGDGGAPALRDPGIQTVSRESTMKFTEEHEWLDLGDDGIVTVGITAHAAEQLGDIVFVELPEVGIEVTKDDEIVVIESVKAASDILAPLDGEIVEVNDVIVAEPGKVNEDPEGDAWFFRMKSRISRRSTTTWTRRRTRTSSGIDGRAASPGFAIVQRA